MQVKYLLHINGFMRIIADHIANLFNAFSLNVRILCEIEKCKRQCAVSRIVT